MVPEIPMKTKMLWGVYKMVQLLRARKFGGEKGNPPTPMGKYKS